MKTGKKVLPLILSMLLLSGITPTIVFAAETADGLEYEDDGSGVKIIGYNGGGDLRCRNTEADRSRQEKSGYENSQP